MATVWKSNVRHPELDFFCFPLRRWKWPTANPRAPLRHLHPNTDGLMAVPTDPWTHLSGHVSSSTPATSWPPTAANTPNNKWLPPASLVDPSSTLFVKKTQGTTMIVRNCGSREINTSKTKQHKIQLICNAKTNSVILNVKLEPVFYNCQYYRCVK